MQKNGALLSAPLVKWERFDRNALAIQILMLLMSEDVTRRMEPIGKALRPTVIDGGRESEKAPKAKKIRKDMNVYMEEHLLKWLDDPEAVGGGGSVPPKWRGQIHLERGLAGVWERSDGKVLNRLGLSEEEGGAPALWDTSALCAKAVGDLMSARFRTNDSSVVIIDGARELLETAWEKHGPK